jgi:hypothetical protein
MKPHKFKPGRRIRTMARFSRLVMDDRWIYHNHKPMHPGWCRGWQFGFIIKEMAYGRLREAIPQEGPR